MIKTFPFLFQHLSFSRDYISLFTGLEAELAAGDILQIRGANGSGKSTLLRILAGYLEPEEGEILWQGKSIYQSLASYQAGIRYLGHQNGIKALLSVRENLELYATIMNEPLSADKCAAILKTLKLESQADLPARCLSAGQSRRLALSRLLLQAASLWLLDEPTTALDAEGLTLLNALLEQHRQNGGISIIATHQDITLGDVKTCLLQ